MGNSGSYLKAKTDALRIFHRSKEDKQALDLQAQIQAQERSIDELEKSFRSIKIILYNNSPFSLVLSDFQLSDGVLWMVQPPPQLQPGDCAVFGAFVQDENAYGPNVPLRGRLSYEGKLPTILFLTKEEERRQKKEEARRKKQERKWAENNALAHVARVQELKDRQALRKLEKSRRRSGSLTDRSSNPDQTTEDDSQSLGTNELADSTISAHDAASIQSHDCNSIADSVEMPENAKTAKKKHMSDKSQKSSRPKKHRRTSSGASSQLSHPDTGSEKHPPTDPDHQIHSKKSNDKAGRRKSTPSSSRAHRTHDSRLTTSASASRPNQAQETQTETILPTAEEEAPYPTSSAPSAPSPIASRSAVPPIRLPVSAAKNDPALEESGGSTVVTPTTTPRSAASTETGGDSARNHRSTPPSSSEVPGHGRRPRHLPSFVAKLVKSPDASSAPAGEEQGEGMTVRTSIDASPVAPLSARRNSAGSSSSVRASESRTPRGTIHDVPQFNISWEVFAAEMDLQETCSKLTVAFNDLIDQTPGHASILVEVQESMAMPNDGTEDSNPHAATSSAPASPQAASSSLNSAPSVVMATFEPIKAEDSPSMAAQHSHGVNADPKYKPTRRVQRTMSAAYLRSAATLKRAELERLEDMTYFDKEEIRELHILFSKITGYTSHITPETFDAFLPELSDPELRRAVFTAFDRSHDFDDRISFDEFVLSLSSMCRGTPEERAKVVFDMCAVNKPGIIGTRVTRDQVLKIVTRVASAMDAAGFTLRDYGNPIQAVNNVFLKQTDGVSGVAGRSMRDRLAVLAKGIAHPRRDERHATRNQTKAGIQEIMDMFDDAEDSSTDNDSDQFESVNEEDGSLPDGENVAAEPPRRKRSKLSLRNYMQTKEAKDHTKLDSSGDRKKDGREGLKTSGSSKKDGRDTLRASGSKIGSTRKLSPRVPRADSSAIPPPQSSFYDIYGVDFAHRTPSPSPSAGHIPLNKEQIILAPGSDELASSSLSVAKNDLRPSSSENELLTARSDTTSVSTEFTSQPSLIDPTFRPSAILSPLPIALTPPILVSEDHSPPSNMKDASKSAKMEASSPEASPGISPTNGSPQTSSEGSEGAKNTVNIEKKDSAVNGGSKEAEQGNSTETLTSPRKKSARLKDTVEVIEPAPDSLAAKRVAFESSESEEDPDDKSYQRAIPNPPGPNASNPPLKGILSNKNQVSNPRRSQTAPLGSPVRTGSPGSPIPSRRGNAKQRIVATHFEEGLSKKQFKMRCKNEPDLAECFGLFDFFNAAVVEPLVKLSAERSVYHKVAIAGAMVKERGSMSRKIGKWGDKRYFVMKDGFLGYSKRPGGPLLRAIPLFNASIKPNITDKKFSLTIIAPYFHRKLSLPTADQAQLWVHALRTAVRGKNRFKSFAPPRKSIAVRPFMNGKEYFDALVPVLMRCRRRLFISGWYLSPGLLLKRGAVGTAMDRFRLDNLLLEAANRGVSIYMIIYNAPGFTGFDLQPSYVCSFFNNLHPNIHILMHPNYYVPSMWSHHQKLVVCDESVAFIGGIDLCYGRYEDSDYSITDPNETKYPGRDYCNVFLENESNGPSEESLIDRSKQPRMPWSDVQVQIDGMAAFDVAINFMQRWDHIVREGTAECKPMPFIFPSHSVTDIEQQLGTIDAVTGQPFATVEVQMIATTDARSLSEHDRSTDDSMGSTVSTQDSYEDHYGGGASSQEEATTSESEEGEEKKRRRHGLHRGHRHRHQNNDAVSGPGFQFVGPEAPKTIVVPEIPWDSRVPFENLALNEEDLGCQGCNVQIVRSVSAWSAGTLAPEQSIYKAYVDMITDAQHLIFIQNQYFISSIDKSAPKNRLLDALYRRLKVAIENKQDFRVLVLIPVLPGGGAIESASTRYMLKYTYRTISRGGHSLLEKLQQDYPGVDVHQYVKFGTPRQIGRIGDNLISEPVYIHSKVMIVDDRRAIIGSANINDRSLRGTRDSEIACVIEPGLPSSRCQVTMNGLAFEGCHPVHGLRVRMWADMVGVKVNSQKPEDVGMMEVLKDPFSGIEMLMHRAEINTKAYLRVFPGMIPNTIYRISDFKRALVSVGNDVDPIVRDQRLEDMSLIRGIITSWPFEFLKDEPIGIGFFEKEYMVPRIIFL
jgi:phospholipase D1/2